MHPYVDDDPQRLRQPEQPQAHGWLDFFRRFGPNTQREHDLEAQVCRPPQSVPQRAATRANLEAGSTVFVEKCQLMLNGILSLVSFSYNFNQKYHCTIGKCINSLDNMKQDVDQCPESYLAYCRATGQCGNGFTAGITYDDFRKAFA